MKYHWLRLYSLLLMIILFSMTVFSAYGGLGTVYKESATQRSIIKSVQDINRASTVIMNGIANVAASAAKEQYDELKELASKDEESSMSEIELEGYFRKGYANRIRQALGENGSTLCASLDGFLKNDGMSNLSVADDPQTVIDLGADDTGFVTSLKIKNVTINSDGSVYGKRSDTQSYSIQFPDAVFHAGSDELFGYCLVAGKGIYITGRTSSIMGDIYAGVHSDEERRDAEIVYGETGTYGGINFLSTQAGVRADRIVSEGDININGSFVSLAPLEKDLNCYAQRINEISGFSKGTAYDLDGTLISVREIDEGMLEEYYGAIRLVDTSLSGLDSVSVYYDSKNDRFYEGKYRKLIANADIDIKDDFTGIVMTPGNVIIHNDVNFEGTILCGDRIYIMGNNNIVANTAVVRAVIASEQTGEYTVRVSDYISGMKQSGLTDPEYYVIPYR